MEFESIRNEAYLKALDIMNIMNKGNPSNLLDLEYIQYRIKSKDSILNKMKKVGNNIYDVYDLIGVRYVFRNLNNSDKFFQNIKNIKDFKIIEIRDYLETGHPEDPNYKTLHIRLKYDNFPCEVQIMDTKMSEHVIMTHDDYKEGLLR